MTEDELVDAAFACPGCAEQRMDWLPWDSAGETVTCATCGADYDPLETPQ